MDMSHRGAHALGPAQSRAGGSRSARAALALLLATIVACQPAAPAGQASPAATPAAEKLTFVQSATIDSLDPQVTRRNEGQAVTLNIHEGLVQRDPKTMQPQPALAVSWTNPDPKTWVFKLRTGVKFQNGEPFDAQTVKYNFDRIVRPDLNSATGATLVPIIDRVDVVDDATVRIVTKTPSAWLLERLMGVRFVPPKETAEKGNDYVAGHPVGTGPYKFVEWVPAQRVVLERNDAYWGPKPAYRQVIFREIQEATTAIAELLTGNVDIIQLVPTDQIGVLNSSGKATVKVQPTQVLIEVPLDALGRTGPTPFQDKRVRQAANYAIDKEAIAKNLLGAGTQLATSFLSPVVFGYDPSLKPYPYDQAKAKQLLAEAGYPTGFAAELKVYPLGSYVDSKVLGEAIISDLGKVGIRASLKQVSSADIGNVIRGGQAGPMYLRQNECATSFDAAICFSFYQKGSIFAYFSSDRLEELRLKAEATTDQTDRLRQYAEIQRYMFDEAPTIFGWTGLVFVGVGNKVEWAPQADNLARLFLAKPK